MRFYLRKTITLFVVFLFLAQFNNSLAKNKKEEYKENPSPIFDIGLSAGYDTYNKFMWGFHVLYNDIDNGWLKQGSLTTFVNDNMEEWTGNLYFGKRFGSPEKTQFEILAAFDATYIDLYRGLYPQWGVDLRFLWGGGKGYLSVFGRWSFLDPTIVGPINSTDPIIVFTENTVYSESFITYDQIRVVDYFGSELAFILGRKDNMKLGLEGIYTERVHDYSNFNKFEHMWRAKGSFEATITGGALKGITPGFVVYNEYAPYSLGMQIHGDGWGYMFSLGLKTVNSDLKLSQIVTPKPVILVKEKINKNVKTEINQPVIQIIGSHACLGDKTIITINTNNIVSVVVFIEDGSGTSYIYNDLSTGVNKINVEHIFIKLDICVKVTAVGYSENNQKVTDSTCICVEECKNDCDKPRLNVSSNKDCVDSGDEAIITINGSGDSDEKVYMWWISNGLKFEEFVPENSTYKVYPKEDTTYNFESENECGMTKTSLMIKTDCNEEPPCEDPASFHEFCSSQVDLSPLWNVNNDYSFIDGKNNGQLPLWVFNNRNEQIAVKFNIIIFTKSNSNKPFINDNFQYNLGINNPTVFQFDYKGSSRTLTLNIAGKSWFIPFDIDGELIGYKLRIL